MAHLQQYPPTHRDRQIAQEELPKLIQLISEVNHPENLPEISLLETGRPIKIPFSVLKMVAEILKNYLDGNSVSIVPVGTVFTTQAAADYLNCSRPHVVKLIDEGKLKAEKVGRHRRIQFKHLMEYKKALIGQKKAALRELMRDSEDLGLYETVRRAID